MQMSLSGTINNDLDNPSFGTLAKRILSNSVASVDSSQDIDFGQLSTTKPLKTIKKEID